MRRAASALLLAALLSGAIAVGIALLEGGAARSADAPVPQSAAGWQGLLGVRPVPQLGDREIVVLELPSLAGRVSSSGSWTTAFLEDSTAMLTSGPEILP